MSTLHPDHFVSLLILLSLCWFLSPPPYPCSSQPPPSPPLSLCVFSSLHNIKSLEVAGLSPSRSSQRIFFSGLTVCADSYFGICFTYSSHIAMWMCASEWVCMHMWLCVYACVVCVCDWVCAQWVSVCACISVNLDLQGDWERERERKCGVYGWRVWQTSRRVTEGESRKCKIMIDVM